MKFYENKLSFSRRFKNSDFAIVNRDEIEIHLWAAYDNSWKLRNILLFIKPIRSGAESFLAATASCRIQVEDVGHLFNEYKKQGVLYHPTTIVEETQWKTREFPVLDLYRNLLTFLRGPDRSGFYQEIITISALSKVLILFIIPSLE